MLKKEIIKLRKKGFSYSEISKKVNKSVKYVWKTAKDIRMTKEGLNRYQTIKGIVKQIKVQGKMNVKKVRIISHLLFDGTVYSSGNHKVAKYINSSKNLIDQFIEDVREVYGINPSAFEILEGKKLPIYKVNFSSKNIYNDLLKYSPSFSTGKVNSLPNELLKNDEFKIELLKAFFEDEGSISLNGRIMADLKDFGIISELKKLAEDLGIKCKICRYSEKTGDMYKLYIPFDIENLEKIKGLRLFDKSIVTYGLNCGKSKLEVLNGVLAKLKKA